jgi:hypothetical protein
VGADVAAAFTPETPRQFILPENESVLAKKISNLKKSLLCLFAHSISKFDIYLPYIYIL